MAKLGGLLDFAGRTARAVDQGYDLDNVMYHASKQDIKEFKPGYDDGLVFLTPNKEFANKWLGKGKFQERQDGTGAIEGVRAEIKQLRKEADEIMESLPDDQASQYYREVFDPKRSQLLREEQLSDSAIYPVVTKTKKPFVPSKDVDVLEELYGKEYLEAPFGSGFATFRDAMKDGNYLLYENKQVVDFLKSKGYDSMFLKESSGEAQPFTTLAVFKPSDIRSVNAQFDPKKTDSANLLASPAATTLGAGLLGTASVPSIQDKAKATGEVARQAIGGLLSPIAAAPHVLIQALTSDMPTDQIDQNYQRLINQPRFQPKTQLGQQYSQQAQQAMANALRGPLAAASAVTEPIQPILSAAAQAAEKLPRRAQVVGRSILDLL